MSRFGHHVGHLLKHWLFVFHSALVCTENLNASVVVMKSAQDGA
jgi:hypothetical protein